MKKKLIDAVKLQELNKKINILIPQGDTPFTQFTIDSLSRHKNIEIHIVSSKNWIESRFSSNIKSFIFNENIDIDQNQLQFLEKIILKKNIDVLLPLHFESIRFVSKYKNEFKKLNINCIVPSVESIDIANDKWVLSKYLSDNKFLTPKTFHFNELNDYSAIKFPVIIKPLRSWNGNKIQMVNNCSELNTLRNEINSKELFIIQEFVQGVDFCFNVMCLNGKVLAYTMQKGVLPHSNPFKSHLGCEFLHNKDLLKITKRLILQLNWSGIANFDIRYNPEENKFYIIEINPRFWGSMEASTMVGVNFPYLLCLESLNIPFKRPTYKYENFISNRGILKILKSILIFNKKNIIPIQNFSLHFSLKDPLPKFFKYLKKIHNKIDFGKQKQFKT